PAGGNNTDCHSTEVTPESDVSMVKTGPGSINAADQFSWNLAVSNAGPSTATNVQITDTLPAEAQFVSAGGGSFSCSEAGGIVSCSAASLGAGATETIALTVIAPDEGGQLDNCADVGAGEDDPAGGNNTDCHSTEVDPVTDLDVAKTSVENPVQAGGLIEWQVTVTNNGPSTASDVTVTDTLPAEVSFVSAGGAGFS